MNQANPWKFALALAAVLWVVVLVINWLGPGEVLVTVEQAELLEKSGHIEKIMRYPDKLVIHLSESLFVRSDKGDTYTDKVYIVRNKTSLALEQRGAESSLASAELPAMTSSVGEWTIFTFIAFGVVFLGLQIRQDRRSGSVRRQIAELDASYRAGAIEEEIYRKKLEDLLPKL